MKFLAATICALALAAPAVAAPGPESPPGAHKARITRKAYWYRNVWYAKDGTPIHVTCRVRNVTRCWIVSIG